MPTAKLYKLPQRFVIQVLDSEGKVIGYDFARSEYTAHAKVGDMDKETPIPVTNGELHDLFPELARQDKRKTKRG
jgi:hypothetical protein